MKAQIALFTLVSLIYAGNPIDEINRNVVQPAVAGFERDIINPVAKVINGRPGLHELCSTVVDRCADGLSCEVAFYHENIHPFWTEVCLHNPRRYGERAATVGSTCGPGLARGRFRVCVTEREAQEFQEAFDANVERLAWEGAGKFGEVSDPLVAHWP